MGGGGGEVKSTQIQGLRDEDRRGEGSSPQSMGPEAKSQMCITGAPQGGGLGLKRMSEHLGNTGREERDQFM